MLDQISSARAQDSTAPSRGFAPFEPRLPGVTAGLGYVTPMAERAYVHMYQPPAGVAWTNCEYRMHEVRIADARAMAMPPDLDREGFSLWDAPTGLSDFSDEDRIRRHYYAEAAELAKLATGADQAFVFDHAIRRRESGRPALNFGRDGDGNSLGAVGRVHNDYSDASGRRRQESVAATRQLSPDWQRFAIVNIWRSIRGKVLDTPLALCDARTISAVDPAVTELRYRDRTGEIYQLHHARRHRWAYFSELDGHEALVFKQYDSQLSGVARFTPHAAFDLPEIPPDIPLRVSIEIRCLVTYR